MTSKILSAVGFSLFLVGCVTTSGNSDKPPLQVLTPQEETALRQRMAIAIESSIAAYAIVAPPAFKFANISGPYETNVLFKGRALQYCVEALMDTNWLSARLKATISVFDSSQNGQGGRRFELKATRAHMPECNTRDPKPYPELIQLREQRRARNAANAADNPPSQGPR